MISAFGVEHGEIAKSLLPGGIVKPAKALTSLERGDLRFGIRQRKEARLSFGSQPSLPNRGRPVTDPGNGGRTISRQLGLGVHGPKWGDNSTKWLPSNHPMASNRLTNGSMSTAGGKAWVTSNRGTGAIRMFGDKGGKIKGTPAADVLRHEQRHISPKRNPIRFRERMNDPYRKGREEGRADFGIPRDHDYAGSPEFRRGYEDVQSRMLGARQKKNSVRKSYAKIGPKLNRAMMSQPWGPTMQERMRANYIVGRIQQGENKAKAAYSKEFTQASLKSIQNMNRRRKRVLP